MLNSLEIRNYRNLKRLTINSLCRVNLITGKNNTGKSTILEALALYASKGAGPVIHKLLTERGEYSDQEDNAKNPLASDINPLASLFTDRQIGFDIDNAIVVGPIEHTLFGEQASKKKSLSIRFVKFLDEVQTDQQGARISKRTILTKNDNDKLDNDNVSMGVQIAFNSWSTITPGGRILRRPWYRGLADSLEKYQFIRTRNIDKEINGYLFDNIALTEKESYIIDALKIIEPSTERIAFVGEHSNIRTAVIKLKNIANPLPLRSMGDGINRILTIILALVSCDNGYLLIDEFENGFHYTVQEKLWKIIFKLSQLLNIQVFATTHSEDCIAGFEHILNSPDNEVDGKLIRLDIVDGEIKQVEFNAAELKIATDRNIETR